MTGASLRLGPGNKSIISNLSIISMLQISFLRSQCLKYLSDLYAFPLFVASMIRWMRPGFEVVYEDVSRLSLEEDVPKKARSFEHHMIISR